MKNKYNWYKVRCKSARGLGAANFEVGMICYCRKTEYNNVEAFNGKFNTMPFGKEEAKDYFEMIGKAENQEEINDKYDNRQYNEIIYYGL